MNILQQEGAPYLPLPEQHQVARDWSPIGVGIFGLADALIMLGIRYGSDKAIVFCDNVGNIMAKTGIEASCDYAIEYIPFFECNPIKTFSSSFCYNHMNSSVDSPIWNKVKTAGMANSQLFTIAPTGTISTMLGISGGIEPIFAAYYDRKTESLHGEEKHYRVYTPVFQKGMEALGINDFNELPDYFICAHDITPLERIEMQAAWQEHIDASISSTINLPNNATVEDIAKIYYRAWKSGLKGVTVYRDGCARGGVLTTDSSNNVNENIKSTNYTPQRGDIVAVDDNVIGLKRKLMTGCGSLHVMAYFDRSTGLLTETFFTKGSSGGCERNLDGLSRMISLACRGGVNIEDVIDQLNSVMPCPAYTNAAHTKKVSKGTSCPNAIGRALLDMHNEIQNWLWDEDSNSIIVNYEDDNETAQISPSKCPECGEPLTHEGGCVQCNNCGWSRCN